MLKRLTGPALEGRCRTFITYLLCCLGTLFLALSAQPVSGAVINVPNASFESPQTDFANPFLDDWQKAPEPGWYNDPMFPWEQLMGQFLNTPNESPDHIYNVDGQQAAFLFALPDVALFQDYTSVSESASGAPGMFHAQFEAGKSYALTVGLLGGGGGMSNGATFEIALYYRDAASNMVTVAATNITNSQTQFPTNSYLTDFRVQLPFVKPTDAWAGKRIGIRLASTVGFDLLGGYWDIDNVRLTESVIPNGSFESPETDFANPFMDAWEKAPQPVWYNDPMFPWEQLMGQFLNTANGSPDHINNLEGKQAAFLFALPDVALTQDLTRRFEPGKSYALTVGALGGGGGMSNGAALKCSLYYRDATSNRVTIASTTVTNSSLLFASINYLTDFQVHVPVVTSNDPWAGKNIGMELASTVGFDNLGGYWDLDNVRLTESLLANSSFESPETDFAHPAMDGWRKAPQPIWYNDPMFPWDQLVGQFLNTPRGSADHIDNVDGKQAAFLFALPDVAIDQELDATYEKGKSYLFTLGAIGGTGGMSNGATLHISFYYRDPASNLVAVATTTITNNSALFPTSTHLTDFSVHVPTLRGGEAWANQRIGIQIASGVGFQNLGGYWDLDNARLRITEDPTLINQGFSGGNFQFTLQSAPGVYEVMATENLTTSVLQWTSIGTFTNYSGIVPVIDTNPIAGQRLYQVRPSP